jgi:hypothetical protein
VALGVIRSIERDSALDFLLAENTDSVADQAGVIREAPQRIVGAALFFRQDTL